MLFQRGGKFKILSRRNATILHCNTLCIRARTKTVTKFNWGHWGYTTQQAICVSSLKIQPTPSSLILSFINIVFVVYLCVLFVRYLHVVQHSTRKYGAFRVEIPLGFAQFSIFDPNHYFSASNHFYDLIVKMMVKFVIVMFHVHLF